MKPQYSDPSTSHAEPQNSALANQSKPGRVALGVVNPRIGSRGLEPAPSPGVATPRSIALRSRGQTHGPITRLVSPSDIGTLIKPFVFLDLFQVPPTNDPLFGWHPHSGIATLTVVHEGAATYEETTGRKGALPAGGVEWMRAGRGVWHTGSVTGATTTKGFQLWIALPEDLESTAPQSHYLSTDEVPTVGPARVILGTYEGVSSPILAPPHINYLDVQLQAGEHWTYRPPSGHDVAWLALGRGALDLPEPVSAGEIVVFDESSTDISISAKSATRLVIGSALKHPHDLVTGRYSVHTSRAALQSGEREIRRLGAELASAGIIR